MVHKPASTNAAYPLKEWDIITRIGDTPIDDQGMIKLSANERVQYQYLVQKLAQDGKVPLPVVRAGRELPVQLPVSNKKPTVVPGLAGAYPSYFVYGPMVFSAATQEFFAAFTRNNNVSRWIGLLTGWGSPLFPRFGDQPAFEGEELVVVTSPFFPHKLGKGYGEPYYQVVKTVNGVRIKNLSHLVEVLRDSREEFTVIEFDSRVGETLVFPRKEMLAATEEILTDNGVRSQGTADTLAVWNAKPAR